MTDKTHLEEFGTTVTSDLSKKLVTAFIASHRDNALKTADVVTRLKEVLEQGLREDGGALTQPDRS